MTQKDYNQYPVEYCKSCKSLKIIDFMGLPMCKNCNTINFTDTCNINEWLEF